jgi:tetratricopeptide (TPR) repeat protein
MSEIRVRQRFVGVRFDPFRLAAIFLLALSCLVIGCGQKQPDISTAEAIRRGDEASAAQDFKAAIAAYRIAVQKEPENGDFRLKLAAALRGNQQWPNFVQEAIRASDLLPGNREAQLLAIEGMNRTQRFDDALDRLTPIIKTTPDDPRVLTLFGNTKAHMLSEMYGVQEISEAWRKGANVDGVRLKLRRAPTRAEDREADVAFRKALAIQPRHYAARMSLIGFLWATNRMEEGAEMLKTAADESPAYGNLSRALGLYYEQREQFADAEKYLKMAASTNDRDSRLTLSDFYKRRGQLAEGLAALAPVTTEDPDFAAAIRAAELELALGEPAKARDRVSKVVEQRPNDAHALRVKAAALLASGNSAEALQVARRAVETDPISREARITLGSCLLAAGNLTQAFDEYSQAWQSDTRDPAVAKALARVAFALGRFGIAVDLANQSLRLKPGDTDAAVILARSHIRLGEFADADRALAPFTGKNASPEILALQGKTLAARGNVDAARAAFMKALQIDRDAVDALGSLVELEIKAGQAAKIHPQIEQALARHPRDPAYLLLSAKIASAGTDFPRAEQALRAILDSDAAREDAVLLLTSILADQGRLKDAQAVAEKSLARVGQSSRVRMKLGEILELQGFPSESQAQYEKVISDNQLAGATTDMIEAFHTASARLAALFANQGIKLDQALQLASTATRYRPADPFFSDTLGWVHVRKNRARIGLPYLQAALDSDPANAAIRYHLGVAYEQLGEIARARIELTRALQENPRFKGADEARALLKAIGK